MTRSTCPFLAFPTFVLMLTAIPSCHSQVTHVDDDDYAWRKKGWKRSIGTDHQAGNNEYLWLDDHSMEWSSRGPGRGYLYGTEPESNKVIWFFKELPEGGREQRVITVEDGMKLVVTHSSGTSFEIKVIRQTDYYIKIFYRSLIESE